MKPYYSFFLLLLCFSLAQSQVNAALLLAEKPKITQLFNGDTTEYWKPIHRNGWELEDGTLKPSSKHRKNNYLWTRETYDDFILTLQYKLSVGANSGVFIRADPSNPVQAGIEIQLLDGPSKQAPNGALDKHSNGAIYDAVAPREYSNRAAGEWNALLIYARGSFVAVYVNGNQVATAKLDQWTRAGTNPDGTKNKFKKALSTFSASGKIGLQYHGNPVWFRDIAVTELDEYSPDLTKLTPRRPANEKNMEYWLRNMIEHHHFDDYEVGLATGLSLEEISLAKQRFDIQLSYTPIPGAPLRTLPYPGGRHPRLGFLNGAIDPQRETKLSVFLPWDPASYVVADVPEAIFTNLGLSYLAHTHVPSIWTSIGVELEPLEWSQHPDGRYSVTRNFPNDISYSTIAVPTQDAVYFQIQLNNGTSKPLTNMRLQNCIMLRGAPEFSDFTKENKLLTNPYVAVQNHEKNRWIITAWHPFKHPRANPNCPCMHSDPGLPDCPANETVSATGILSFYEGDNIDEEFNRLEKTGWRNFFE